MNHCSSIPGAGRNAATPPRAAPVRLANLAGGALARQWDKKGRHPSFKPFHTLPSDAGEGSDGFASLLDHRLPPRRIMSGTTFQEKFGFNREGALSGGRTPWVQPHTRSPHRAFTALAASA